MALKLESSKAQRTWQRKKLNGWTPDMHKYFWWLQKKKEKKNLAIWIMELETAMINRYPVTGHWCPSLPAIPHLCLVDWTEVLPRAKPSSVLSVAKEKNLSEAVEQDFRLMMRQFCQTSRCLRRMKPFSDYMYILGFEYCCQLGI